VGGGGVNDVILTGLPRAGTTLTCELLNAVPDTVALDEPMDWRCYAGDVAPGGLPAADACANIGRFLAQTRSTLLSRGTAVSKHVDGRVLGKKISDAGSASGVRVGLAERGEIVVGKALSTDFRLVVKQVAGFAALLEPLRDRFPVFAVIRNPLSVLTSWQTVPLPIRHGHVVIGEALDTGLARSLSVIDDRLERQLYLLAWFFARFCDLLPPDAIIRYEDMVASGGRALRRVSPGAQSLDVALESRNQHYDPGVIAVLGSRLLEVDGPWWRFYPPASVEELMGVRG
jgi:hypothetical protein